MGNRDFSDSIKLEIIKTNLEKNNGDICCEVCGKKLISISECHFDHIEPFVKGGRSTLENCQILCVECNLRKNDKQLKDFVLEEKAKRFFAGEALVQPETKSEINVTKNVSDKITKEDFDKAISDYINRKGDIHKVDFSREYNHLPSIHYVRQFYGDLNNLKKAFGIIDMSYNWNRETIKEALDSFILNNGTVTQKDLNKANRLPSIPCILNYYPEYKTFTDIKQGLCNLDVPTQWTVDSAINAGRKFVQINGKINQKDLRSVNNLPSAQVIDKLFGSLSKYQEMVGSAVSRQNLFVSKEDINKAVELYFENSNRVVESQQIFFESFIYSPSTILKRYGSFGDFCKEHNIIVLKTKKAKYTKREVDDAISNWVKEGKPIPLAKELTKVGLPSLSVILKYYEDWKEPFYLYEKLYEEVGRNNN